MRAQAWTILACTLHIRCYKQLAGIDLDRAIVLGRDALPLCPPGHPLRSMYLNDLALCLSFRYNELGGVDDLNEAIVLARDALFLCPPGHPHRLMHLNNAASRLFSRYKQLGGVDDLNEAVVLG